MLRLGLFLLQEVDDEVLVLLYKVVRETLLFQVIAKMLPPFRIKRLQDAELGLVTVDTPRRLPAKVPDGRSPCARRFGWRWRRCRGVPMPSENAAQQAVLVMTAPCARSYPSKWCRFGRLARVLFPVVHLFLELLGLLLVCEAQASHAVFYLEGVEEGSVLVVAPRVEYLLVPDDPSHGRL